jgi:iron complex outermembrane receptor protein
MTKPRIAALLMSATMLTPAAALAQTTTDSPAAEEEIVVTAQRREEKLKDVPIAITAISKKQLEESGVSGSLQLSTITPGLNFVVQGAYAQPTIRGIGTTVTGAGADANVSIYVDGVYQPSQVANAFDFNNVERIEVLKGPQGTLFGRNATGGAISVTTLKPSFENYGQLSLGYGSFNERRAKGYGTVALGEKVAADLAFTYKEDDGYVDNINPLVNGKTAKAKSFGIRSKLLIDFTEDFNVILAGGYGENHDNSLYITRPLNRNNVALRTVPTLVIPSDIRVVNVDTDAKNDAKTWFVNLTASYSLGSGELTSLTAYQDTNITLLVDSDVTSIASSSNLTTLPQQTFSQEFSYASGFSGPFNFTAGVYYYDDDALRRTINSRGVGGAVTQDFTVEVKTQAAAIYGEIYYDVTDALRLIAGARYSTETKKADGTYRVGGTIELHTEETWNAFTPRLSLVYKIDESSNIYATYSRGFKSGSYNTTTLAQPTPVSPEFVNAYEVGYKISRPGFTLNTSAFYYDYTDIQVGVQTNVGGVSQGVLQNAAAATIYGIDADVTARLSENWRLRFGAAYTHGVYDEYFNALLTTPRVGGGNTQTPGDASGKDMIRSPELMVNGTLTYTTDLAGGSLEASATVSYNGGFYWDPGNRVKQDAYTLINANMSWTDPSNSFKAEVWGSNLTDEEYYYYVTVSSTGDSASYQRPRTFGVMLTAYF